MWIWRLFGFVFLAVGALGVLLPVLPTTVFWILAALAFARSDPAWRDWIYGRPGVGRHVRLFVEQGAMTRSGKRGALAGMALAALVAGALLWRAPVIMGATLALIGLGAVYVVSRRTV